MNLGMTELLLIAGIALLFFGPSRLPGLGKSVGQAIRGFKKGLNEDSQSDEDQNSSRRAQQLPHESTGSTQKQSENEKTRQS